MADFTVILAAGAANAVWTDPTVTGKPTRINPLAALPHRIHTVSAGLTVHALVGGALVADAGLGGRLFLWSWVDIPGGAPPAITPTAGTSAEVIFPAARFITIGHYTILAQRDAGGNVGISWEVV
ncbi:MAG: hypothetical protein V3W41_22100 [Planctomycetota bacterium]